MIFFFDENERPDHERSARVVELGSTFYAVCVRN